MAKQKNAQKSDGVSSRRRGYLILTIPDTDYRFVLDIQKIKKVALGYRDSNTDSIPDIDLLDYGALSKNVSKSHAAIIAKYRMIQVLDFEGSSGTWLNGQQLEPKQP